MINIKTFLIFLMLVILIAQGSRAQDDPMKCKSEHYEKLGRFKIQTLTSPGFPEPYPQEDSCYWTISNPTDDNKYFLQLYASVFELNDCNGDSLKIFEGDEESNVQEVENWCTTGPKIFTATKKVVRILFQSSKSSTKPGQGFMISYGLVQKPIMACHKDVQGEVHVGVNPFVASFEGAPDVESCQWLIKEEDAHPKKKLVIELISHSDIACADGHYSLYEGSKMNDHLNYHYCATSQPFSKIYMKSNMALLKYENRGNKVPSPLLVKISQISTESNDCQNVDIEVPDQPVFFSLPFAISPNGQACPINVMASNQDMTIRIDALGTDSGPATCQDALLSIKDINSDNLVEGICNRKRNPAYFAQVGAVMVRQASQKPVFVRATALKPECANSKEVHRAVEDLTLIKDFSSDNLGRCTKTFKAASEDEIIYLKIVWSPSPMELGYATSQDGVCDGDFINVYDGEHTTSTLLYSSCTGSNGKRHNIETTVVSTQHSLTVVYDADEKITGTDVTLEYHALPAAKMCDVDREVKVSRTPQVITSPNYPKPLPLNQRCVHHLVSETDERIVVKVVDANLPEDCESMLNIQEGKYSIEGKGESVGKICGTTQGTFYIEGKEGSLVSISDERLSEGGWKVEVYTEASGSTGQQGGSSEDGNTAGAGPVASLLVVSAGLLVWGSQC